MRNSDTLVQLETAAGSRPDRVPSSARSTGSQPATTSDWRYTMCPLGTDPQCFGPFRGLAETWRRRCAGRPLPARRDFEVEDFAPWLGRIFIAQIERNPFDLRFTLWGTQLRDWWRVDYTGRTLGELSSDPDLWDTERHYFHAMDIVPFFGVSSGYLSLHGRGHVKVVGLDLPMSDGGALTHVVSAHMQIGRDQTVENLLPDCPLVPFADTAER